MLFGLRLFLVAPTLELAPEAVPKPCSVSCSDRGRRPSELEDGRQVQHRGPKDDDEHRGKMKITVGKSILIGDFIAFSSRGSLTLEP